MSHLAHDAEGLVRRSYPAAQEEIIVVLARNSFIDAVQDQQIYFKQAEFEAFLKATGGLGSAARPHCALQGRKAKVEKKAESRKVSPKGFHGSCWGCGEKGHRRSRCPREPRTRSLDWLSTGAFQPCCKNCGESGHRYSACPKLKEVAQA